MKNVVDGVIDNGIDPHFFVKNIDKNMGVLYMKRNYYKNKAERIIKYMDAISKKLKDSKSKDEKTEEDHIVEGLKKAYEEWQMKEEYFENVSDPDLIDHAIYELKASKIKYIYFLKRAKEIENK